MVECLFCIPRALGSIASPTESKTKGTSTYTSNPSTGEAGAGGTQIQGQPGLHSKILSQNKKKKSSYV